MRIFAANSTAVSRIKPEGLLALKLAQALARRVVPLGLWRLADRYPAAQTEVLGVLPKLAASLLSPGKASHRRLRNPRQGSSSQ